MDTDRPFDDPNVAAVFDAHPTELRGDLLFLRAQIFNTAMGIEGVCPLVETLTGLCAIEAENRQHRQAGWLKERATPVWDVLSLPDLSGAGFSRTLSGPFDFEGNRALLFTHGEPVPLDALRHCIALSLTYHLRRRRSGSA